MLQNEDEKYLHIREKLRSLPQVKASDNFMVSLQHKINLIDAESHNLSSKIHKETHERINQGAFAKFFGFQQRPWLIPSLSFTVVIFLVLTIVYFGYFNTSGTNDTQTATGNNQTITQNNSANNNNTTPNNSGNNKEGGNGNTSSTPAPTIGNTDSQPGNDEGLLATNDDRLGKTDSYNNRRVSNTNNKLVVTESGNLVTTNETPDAPISSDENESGLQMNSQRGANYEQATQIESKTNGNVKEEIKSAMKPFDEKSGVSVDAKKKDSSKNPRNIREVTNIGKTDLEEIMNALTGE